MGSSMCGKKLLWVWVNFCLVHGMHISSFPHTRSPTHAHSRSLAAAAALTLSLSVAVCEVRRLSKRHRMPEIGLQNALLVRADISVLLTVPQQSTTGPRHMLILTCTHWHMCITVNVHTYESFCLPTNSRVLVQAKGAHKCSLKVSQSHQSNAMRMIITPIES